MNKKGKFQPKMEMSFFKTAFENAIKMKEELERTREALLYMMGDVNDAAFRIARAKKDWEERFDFLGDMILVVDKDYNILKANQAMSKVLGGKPQDIIGTKCYGLFHRAKEPCHNCPHKTTIETEFRAIEEVEGPRHDRTSLVSTYPLLNKEGVLYASIHVSRDITEIKEGTKTQEEFNEKKMEVKRELIEVSEALSHTFEMEMVIEEAFSIGKKIVGFDFALYYQWDEDIEMLIPTASLGLDGPTRGIFLSRRLSIEDLNTSIVDRIVKKEKVITIEKVEEDPPDSFYIFNNDFHSASVMLIPLRSSEDFLGLLVEGYTSPHSFSSLEKEVSRGMAHHITRILDNTKLYEESLNKVTDISKKIETIAVMHEIDRTILSSHSRHEILSSVVQMVKRLVLCDGVAVVTVDRLRKGFIREAEWTEGIETDKFVPFKETSCTRILETRKPMLIADLGMETPLLPLERRLFEQGFRSILRVPLTIREKVVGILSLDSKKKEAFTTEDIFTSENIAYQISIALENSWLVEDLKGLLLGTIESLASAIDAKSHWTKGHSERVTEYALMIGKEMRLDDDTLKDLRLVGLLHDVGKIGTYGVILDKPGKLVEEEFEIVKQHPKRGAEILCPIKQFRDIIPAIQYHHECYDGRGYPEGLKGEDIPLLARILSVTDAYDSMTSDRPYRKAIGRKKAVEELKRCSGTQFDPNVVDAFLKALGKSV